MTVQQAVAKKPPLQIIAAAISAIVHPVALPLLTLVVVTTTLTGQMRQGLTLAGAALLLTTAPVAALVGVQVARGRWTDLDVSVREQRYALYPIGMVCARLMVGAFILLRAPLAGNAASAAWATGDSLTLEQAVALALGEDQAAKRG